MTTPEQRTRAVMQTRAFLEHLCSVNSPVDLPLKLRREARRLLRHYPEAVHVDLAAIAWPDMWAPLKERPPDRLLSYTELFLRLREVSDVAPSGVDAGPDPGDDMPFVERL